MRRVLSRMTPRAAGERRHWSDGGSPTAPTSPPARITAVQARIFTPLGTAVTSGSGSGGGAAVQVDFLGGGVVVCHFFLIQENCTQVGTQVGTASGTPRPTGEKPSSEPSRPQVDFFEPAPGQFLNFVAS